LEKKLSRRKVELEMGKERTQLQQSLDRAAESARNSNDDIVDRSIVANLIVTYIRDGR
jgi:hypothetical protein